MTKRAKLLAAVHHDLQQTFHLCTPDPAIIQELRAFAGSCSFSALVACRQGLYQGHSVLMATENSGLWYFTADLAETKADELQGLQVTLESLLSDLKHDGV
jgi:hypothetical protein